VAEAGNMPALVLMHQPYIVASKSSNTVMVPAVSRSRYPIAVFLPGESIKGFYRVGDNYYVEVDSFPSIRYVITVPGMANSIPIQVKETAAPIPFERDAVVKLVVESIATKREGASMSNEVRIRFTNIDGEFTVPVRSLYRFCMAVSRVAEKAFPSCIEVLAPLLVPDPGKAGGIVDDAVDVCTKVFSGRIRRCTTLQAIAASGVCLAIAARRRGYPLTLGDVVLGLGVPQKYVQMVYRYAVKKLGIGRKELAVDIESYIRRIASELIPDPAIAGAVVEQAVSIYRKVAGHGVSGKDPKGIAAACVYLAANLNNVKITQKQLSEVTGVTEVTIRNRVRELRALI